MPINDALIGNAAGYESLKFTEDGGFVVGGFTKYEGIVQNRFDLEWRSRATQFLVLSIAIT